MVIQNLARPPVIGYEEIMGAITWCKMRWYCFGVLWHICLSLHGQLDDWTTKIDPHIGKRWTLMLSEPSKKPTIFAWEPLEISAIHLGNVMTDTLQNSCRIFSHLDFSFKGISSSQPGVGSNLKRSFYATIAWIVIGEIRPSTSWGSWLYRGV